MTELWLEHPEWLLAVGAGTGSVLLALAFANALARPRLRALLGDAAPPLWRRTARRDALLGVALVAIAVALLGPRIGERTVRTSTAGVDLVLLLDASQSMDARDPAPSRLARAKRAAKAILERLGPGDRVGLAAYAGRGVLLTPLTPDHAALGELVEAVDSRLLRPGGSNLRAGVEAALEAFDPADERGRVVLVLGDGEVMPEASESGALAARRAGARVFAAAFGSEAGAQVPDRGAPLLDRRGRPVVSRRHTESFDALASSTGGSVFLADAWGELELDRVVEAVRRDGGGGAMGRDLQTAAAAVETRVAAAVIGPFAAVGFGLLLLELAWPWGTRSGRPRHAALASASALLFALVTVGAGRPDAPPSPHELLAMGRAHADAGDWGAARRAFLAAAVTASEPRVAGLAYHNLGFAALQQDDLEAARDAFFDSLALRPRDRHTQFDLEWTLRRLEVRSPPQPEEAETRRDAAPARPEEPESTPEPAPDVRAPQPTGGEQAGSEQTGAEPGGTQGGRVRLGAEERAHWLDRVEDDPGAALRDAASRDARPGGRPDGAPAW